MRRRSALPVLLVLALSAILCAGAEAGARRASPDFAPKPRLLTPPLYDRPYRSVRFRGGPKEVCSSFLLTEFSWMWRVGGTGPTSSDERFYGSLDLGWAKNVGSAYAVGATAFLGGDNSREHLGVRARVRRWLAPNLSLDLAPGLILAGEEEHSATLLQPGFIAQASLMADDRLGIVGQVFTSRARLSRSVYVPAGPAGPGYETRTEDVRETGWSAGLKLGSAPGVAATLLVLVLGIIYTVENVPGGI